MGTPETSGAPQRWSFVPINQGFGHIIPYLLTVVLENHKLSLNNLLTSWVRSSSFFNTTDLFGILPPKGAMFQKTLPCPFYNEQNCLLLSDFEIPKMTYKP